MMFPIRFRATLLAAAMGLALPVQAQTQSRGELLYSTHCIVCHTQQMHWRDQRRATDWASLRAQVLRWQREARVDWGDEDVLEVTRYLNDTIYRFMPPPDGRG